MGETMPKLKKVLYLVLLVVVVLGTFYFLNKSNTSTKQNVSSEFISVKGDMVKVNIVENSTVNSPLNLLGEIRGSWSFEGSFPIKLVDSNENMIARGIGTLQGDWMTEKFVPFVAQITFSADKSIKNGYIVISKDNPSDLDENNDFVKIPVKFK